MKKHASGNHQVQAIASSNHAVNHKLLTDPEGFGSVAVIFNKMRFRFSGSWFSRNENQQSLDDKAAKWRRGLLPYRDDVVLAVLAEFISSDDFTAPTLEDFIYRINQKNTLSRKSERQVKNRYMTAIKKTTHSTSNRG